MEGLQLIDSTTAITAAFLSRNPLPVDEVAGLIGKVHNALSTAGEVAERARPEPAVSIRRSVRPDHVVCLECGTKHKMLKRHLGTAHGLTPDEYRAKWDLAADHPLVAPNYAATRRELAKKIGLGRHPKAGRGRKRG